MRTQLPTSYSIKYDVYAKPERIAGTTEYFHKIHNNDNSKKSIAYLIYSTFRLGFSHLQECSEDD